MRGFFREGLASHRGFRGRHLHPRGGSDTPASDPRPLERLQLPLDLRQASPRAPETDMSAAGAADARGAAFCALQRVGARSLLALCSPSGWRVLRVDGFSSASDRVAPVQLEMDASKDGPRLNGARMLRLFEAPGGDLCGLFVTSAPVIRPDEEEDEDAADLVDAMSEDSEFLTVFSLSEQRILCALPPTPSLVVDIQVNRKWAAVLCETRELLIYDLASFKLVRKIMTASPAVALGARWIAYPGRVSHPDAANDACARETYTSTCDCNAHCSCGSAGSPDDVANIEALMGGVSRMPYGSSPARTVAAAPQSSMPTTTSGLLGSSPSYTAIDVAQNVASGLYYLSGIGKATLAPYLSSSPGKPGMATQLKTNANSSPVSPFDSNFMKRKEGHAQQSTSSFAGWVIVQDLVTQQVVCNFECHATALVNLAFDFSGSLLATGSTKGQNLHVYRLAPPLHTLVKGGISGSKSVNRSRLGSAQLLYKLQRGITHATIQDIAFSQDAKWISVTSAHGTSHVFAIHPEGARIGADTHANVVDLAATEVVVPSLPEVDDLAASSADLSASTVFAMPVREVSDFCADFRFPESRTMQQVLKLRHEFRSTPTTPAVNIPDGTANGGTLVGSALDASQALFNHLASSTNLSMDLSGYFDESSDAEARRRRHRRRISCLFAHDGQRLAVCCDSTLKVYDMRVAPVQSQSPTSPEFRGVADHSSAEWLSGGNQSAGVKHSKTSASLFGFEASAVILKTWELGATGGSPSSLSVKHEPMESACSAQLGELKGNNKSELRTFAQRSLPLWAHPKVTFRAINAEHPAGQVLEVKRRGPSQSMKFVSDTNGASSDGAFGDQQQLFVLEMDSYFGIGGSPVFDGRPHDAAGRDGSGAEFANGRDVPPLDLQASINLAMSTNLSTTSPVEPTIAILKPHLVNGKSTKSSTRKNKKAKSKPTVDAVEDDVQASPSLQFAIQDMYFAAPESD